jgi:hypothetical protein
MRRRREKPAEPLQVEWAIAMEGFRPQAIGALVSKGDKLRISDPVVQQHPAFFRGLIELTPELLAGKR